MEVYGKCMVAGPTNVIFLSSILGREGPIPGHKCDWKCENEHVCGNMYRCKLTGITHICDKNCNQRILYDNHSSLCRVSGQIFPFTPAEEQAVRGVRRKLDPENSPADSCAFKRRRDAQIHPSPFERSFRAVVDSPWSWQKRKQSTMRKADEGGSIHNLVHGLSCIWPGAAQETFAVRRQLALMEECDVVLSYSLIAYSTEPKGIDDRPSTSSAISLPPAV